MKLKVYLSGEIHTNWRNEIIDKCKSKNLEIEFSSPTTNHELSDDVGVKIPVSYTHLTLPTTPVV